LKNWREVLLVLLSWVIIWLLARGYESLLIQKMILQKQTTETLITQKGSPDLKQVFKNLGYDVVVPAKPDTSKKGK
jgi:hypothetical protein